MRSEKLLPWLLEVGVVVRSSSGSIQREGKQSTGQRYSWLVVMCGPNCSATCQCQPGAVCASGCMQSSAAKSSQAAYPASTVFILKRKVPRQSLARQE